MMEEFKIGDRVSHPEYGEGVIVLTGYGDGDNFYGVDFDTSSGYRIVTNLYLSKVKETKDMTNYKVGDIVDHPLYNESIIIDISRFESGHIEIVPLTGLSRGLPILVSIDNVKQADDKLIISTKDYNKMNNEIEKLKKKLYELYFTNDKALCAEVKSTLNSYFGTKNLFGIKEVIYHNPATIIFWEDGTKTVVKAQNKEKYDKEKGFVMACLKKILGNKGNYYEVIKKWTD